MSCISDASPIWGPGFAVKNDILTDNFHVYSEEGFAILVRAFVDTYGLGCAGGLDFLKGQFGRFAVVRNGSVMPLPTADMVSGSSIGGFLIFDNSVEAIYSLTDDEGFRWTNGTPKAAVAGVDFRSMWQISVSTNPGGGVWSVPSSAVLKGADLDALFCCATSGLDCPGCGKPPPAIFRGGKFNLPLDPNKPRDVGDENLSAPPLGTPLYFSNFTSQYVRGMKAKPVTFK